MREWFVDLTSGTPDHPEYAAGMDRAEVDGIFDERVASGAADGFDRLVARYRERDGRQRYAIRRLTP